ncbi:MAG: RNA polymerase factor sigma-54 [Candidatus Tectomicrobia bacterium]|nr:RNA polymerase factor sigma-54 [Candidatus Tectomicrobia bacterium]
MALEPRLQLKQTQKLVMTAMLQQAIKLLPLTKLELVELIVRELQENPFLDEETADEDGAEVASSDQENTADESQELRERIDEWEQYFNDSSELGMPSEPVDESQSRESTLSRPQTLTEHLLWQLHMSFTENLDKEIGAYLISNLNEDGYLTLSPEEVVLELGVPLERVLEVLRKVQLFDPVGVGARDLRECLLIQLEQLDGANTVTKKLIEEYLPLLEERNYGKIAKELGISGEELRLAVRLIQELDPKPGSRFREDETVYIVPDLYIIKMHGEYQVLLNDEGIPRLRVHPYYRSILKDKRQIEGSTRQYIEEKFRSAMWLIKSIEQRQQTLLKVARSIVTFQREFLDQGVSHLRPLVLRDVADDIEMHESTVSRVTTRKYMHTPQGIFELKYFFHSGIGSDSGENLSSVTVKEKIRKLVQQESGNQPLTDQQIVDILGKDGIRIARRTVTKYRKELKLPPSSRRKRLG